MSGHFLDFPNTLQCHHRAEMRDALSAAIKRAERGQLRLRIPIERSLMQTHRGMHFHYKPEIFLQLQGRTEFALPDEKFDLMPGEVAIIPAGQPHGETVFPEGNQPFRNIVIGLYSHTLSTHLAKEVSPGKPDIEVIQFFDAPNLDVFEMLATNIVHTFHQHAAARETVLKGLIVAFFGMIQNSIETGSSSLNADVGKIFKVKWLVREQIANPELNVKKIAESLQCSPDYLSNLFHRQTGERLIHYIQRLRIEGAVVALQSTPLYISEVAYASGFTDPAYFARIFRKHTGETPQGFRERIDAERRKPEAKPKTIYFDRVDYSPGTAKAV